MSNSKLLSNVASNLANSSGKILTVANGKIVWSQNYAFDAANNASSNTVIIQGINETQNTNISSAYTQANTGTTQAQAAFSKANSSITLGSTPLYLGSTNTNISGLTLTNPVIDGFTGNTGIINIGSGQIYKDSSGNLGIGTSSPGVKLDVNGRSRARCGFSTFTTDGVFGAGAEPSYIMTPNAGQIIFGYSSPGDGIYYGRIGTSNDNGTQTTAFGARGPNIFSVDTNGTERLRIDSSGTVTVNAGQIKFPATQNASTDANTLDDYEEGTFTITFSGSSSGSGNVSGNAYYTKIGRIVTITLNVNNQTLPTYTGELRFSLPFPCYGTSVTEYRGGDAYFYPSAAWDAITNFIGIVPGCSTGNSFGSFNLIQLDSDRQTSLGNTNSNTSGATNAYLRFSLTYFTNT